MKCGTCESRKEAAKKAKIPLAWCCVCRQLKQLTEFPNRNDPVTVSVTIDGKNTIIEIHPKRYTCRDCLNPQKELGMPIALGMTKSADSQNG